MKRSERYHHGHLREALLEAADALLIEGGLEALSWREIARRAGVSAGAPYHHFADKAAMVRALTHQHLERLDRRFHAVIDRQPDPMLQLRELGLEYVVYALEHPAAFRLMFRPEYGSSFGVEPATAPVFGILLRVVQACRAHTTGAEHTEQIAFAAWALVHGLAALLLDGPLACMADDKEYVHRLVTTSVEHFDVHRQ